MEGTKEKEENRRGSTNQTGRRMRRDFYTEWQRIQLYESEREESVNMARCLVNLVSATLFQSLWRSLCLPFLSPFQENTSVDLNAVDFSHCRRGRKILV